MTPLARYLLLQIPGLIFIALVVTLLLHWEWLDARSAALLVALWVLKDLLLYPIYRPALGGRAAREPGPGALVGTMGRAVTPINGRGQVVIAGERWLARACDGKSIPSGTRVEVVASAGMELHVRRAEQEPGPGNMV